MTRRRSRRDSMPVSGARVALDRAPTPALGEVLDFMRLFWAIDQALQRKSKRMLRTLGVTGPQRLVLRIVGRFPGLSAGDLARLLHVHPSTLTGVIARLEQSGLLARTTDRRDARRSLLALTNKGRRFDVATEGTVEAAVARALAHLRPQQLEATRVVLQSVTESLMDPPMADSSTARAGSRSRPRRSRAGPAAAGIKGGELRGVG
ncbi:MAG: MarR family winged helix-turn-helix transcriptional regulator [Myxococcota bacterium]